MKIIKILFAIQFISLSLFATDYYCDPVNGNMNYNGLSSKTAWKSLEDVFARSKKFSAGDVIYLMNGAHGRPYITGGNSDYVTIKALPNHNPKLAGIQFGKGSYWAFDGLTFTADGSGGDNFKSTFIQSNTDNTHLVITNSVFYMAEDSSNWTFNDWYTYTKNKSIFALSVRGNYFKFNNNIIKNVYFGLSILGDNIEIKNNLIDNFAGDAMQLQNSDNVLIENNIIKDAYIQDYNIQHDDAIQLMGVASPMNNVVVRNNTIYNFSDEITQSMIDDNLVGYSMQGIILTDGKITNSVIENNLVVLDTYHGITINSSDKCRIQNNTIARTPNKVNTENVYPWITFYGGKGGLHTNGVVRNNIAYQYSIASGNLDQNNISISESSLNNNFTDYSSFDFTLKEDSYAIDTGLNTDISEFDLAGNNRLFNTTVDCGAYEYFAEENIIVTEFDKVIKSSNNDGMVYDNSVSDKNNPYITDLAQASDGSGGEGMKLGSVDLGSGTTPVSIILPFQLPEIPNGNIVEKAELNIYVYYGRTYANTNIDLYGLPYSRVSNISSDMHYAGDFSFEEGDNTGIEDNYFAKNVTNGNFDTARNEASVKSKDLANYINAQYLAGAQAGDWVFLRLSPDNIDMNAYHYFMVKSRDDENKAPTLSMSFVKQELMGIDDSEVNKLQVYPNPVFSQNNTVNIKLNNNSNSFVNVNLYSTSGALVYSGETKLQNGKATIDLGSRISTANYILRIFNNKVNLVHRIIVQ